VIDPVAVDAALDRVVDPCSCALGEPLGLREMGLAHEVRVDQARGEVAVTMRLTSPCCAYGASMAVAARDELRRVDGVRTATVEIDHGAIWTPAALTGGAGVRLEVRRDRTRALTGVRPHDWRGWGRAREGSAG